MIAFEHIGRIQTARGIQDNPGPSLIALDTEREIGK